MDVKTRFQDLMVRARRGDPRAVDELVEEFGPQIRREVDCLLRRNRLRHLTNRSDLYQSVIGRFLVLLSRNNVDEKPSLERPEDLKNYLKTMVQNRVFDLGRYHTAQGRDHRRTVRPDPQAPVAPASPQETPSTIVSRAELEVEYRRLCADVMGHLTAESRTVLELRQEGLSWQEVAERIGSGKHEAVRRRCERDLARVRERFESGSARERLEALSLLLPPADRATAREAGVEGPDRSRESSDPASGGPCSRLDRLS